MKEDKQNKPELQKLRKRIAELERIEEKHRQTKEELLSVNQQLDASYQQLQATEQQLQAYNEQLKASELELKTKEEQAQAAREFAENIIDTMRQPLLVLDENLHVISANRFFYTAFQVNSEETIGKLLYELGNNQWDIPALKKLLKKTLPEKSTVENFEVTHNFETIGKRIMLLNARELKQKAEKKRLILLAIEDITSRRQAEEEMQRLNKELKQKAGELQQILYITTHDLRSPLVNIQGFNKELEASIHELNELLASPTIPAEIKNGYSPILQEEIPEAIHFITSSTTKMDKLLSGLLALSRLGRQKLTFQTLDMNRLLRDVLDNYEFEIKENNVIVQLSDLPHCSGDELQLNQLFSNLIGNALKFLAPGKKGEIILSGRKEKNGSFYTIEDNGIGIPKDYQERVFELFQKFDPNKPGIGLGMNIVKQIIEKHNGEIKLESEPGVGTKISIFIPH